MKVRFKFNKFYRCMIKWRKRDKFPNIVICYIIKNINIILIDIGYNKGNNNYWFDFRLFGLGFDYDSILPSFNNNKSFTFKNDYKKYINLNNKGGK